MPVPQTLEVAWWQLVWEVPAWVTDSASATLLRRADLAMYSAKRGGKNALRHTTTINTPRPADAA